MKSGNSFVQSRELAKKLAVATLVCGAGSFVAVGSDSRIQFALLALTFIFCICAIYIVVRYCRCPYCGKRIFLGVLKIKTCPACHRDLESGKKTRKK